MSAARAGVAGRFSGRQVVVTGASSGIGRAVAIAFAAAGARVVVNYANNQDGAEAVVAEIATLGAQAVAIRADVADAESVARLVEQSVSYLGGLDVWCNVAGADILTGAGASLTDWEKLDRLIAVDLRGTLAASWAAAEYLLAHSGGVILNTSWDQALMGMPGRNPELFAAVKSGISGFSRSLARSVAPKVRVNDIAPGWIATAFAEQEMRADYREGVIAATPLGRLGRPEDVAQAFLYLASDAASFITGQTLKVNGGLVVG